SPSHVTILNLLVATAHIQERLERLCEEHEITAAQYNVLRILKGVHPGGHPRCEIARRLIQRAPDLTRMIDRLERRGLVERARSEKERRHSITRITRRGLELIDAMAPAMASLNRSLLKRLSREDAARLSQLCERMYAES